jgi:hypothetical protein
VDLAVAAHDWVPPAWESHALVPYRIQITGTGFYPGDSVKLYVNNRKVAPVHADRGGTFVVTVDVKLPAGIRSSDQYFRRSAAICRVACPATQRSDSA